MADRTGIKSMFIGRHYHALEQKGRLSIPTGFRQSLKTPAVLTAGLEGCLFLFSHKDWEQVALEAASLPFTNRSARDWARYLAGNASEVDFDQLGRILIPDYLRTHAHLAKQTVVVGAFSRIEIWDQERYHTYFESISQDAAAIAEKVAQTTP
jgi:MraZ protein